MRRRNVLLGLLPFVLVLGSAAFRTGTGPARAAGAPAATITVTGTGTVEVAPDEARVTLGATERSTTAARAQAALAGDTTAMAKAILAAGVDRKDITTSGYDLSPSYDNHGKITGYQASACFTVTVRQLASLGTFLDAAVAAGSNRIESIRFERSDIAVYKIQALQKAVADAQTNAGAVAEELGRTLGPVTHVAEGTPNIVPVFEHQAAVAAPAIKGPAPAVEPGRLQVTASVTLTNS